MAKQSAGELRDLLLEKTGEVQRLKGEIDKYGMHNHVFDLLVCMCIC